MSMNCSENLLPLSKKPVNAPESCLLPLPRGCLAGHFLRREKRFSVELEHNGARIWAHCNNSGAMLGLLRPGSPILISPAPRPGRKLPWTVERIFLPQNGAPPGSPKGFWVGVNTSLPNRLIEAAFHAGLLDFAKGYTEIRREAPRGSSRLDALFTGPGLPPLWVECKNVTLLEDGRLCFPDAESARARKHLLELMDLAASGAGAAMFYLAQRPDGACFGPADFIDPEYARLFYLALEKGVQCHVHRAIFTDAGTSLGPRLPLAKMADSRAE